jgi:hypothetical protein
MRRPFNDLLGKGRAKILPTFWEKVAPKSYRPFGKRSRQNPTDLLGKGRAKILPTFWEKVAPKSYRPFGKKSRQNPTDLLGKGRAKNLRQNHYLQLLCFFIPNIRFVFHLSLESMYPIVHFQSHSPFRLSMCSHTYKI